MNEIEKKKQKKKIKTTKNLVIIRSYPRETHRGYYRIALTASVVFRFRHLKHNKNEKNQKKKKTSQIQR